MIPYDELDPGIRKHVRALNDAGIKTTDSGDGVSKIGTPGEACMLPFPNVMCALDQSDNWPKQAWAIKSVLDEIEDGWSVEVSWSTRDQTAIAICFRDDGTIQSAL